jgi:hypothetical protein
VIPLSARRASRHARRRVVTLSAVVAALFVANSCPAQQFGHKLLGGLGLQAGVQPDTGLYVGDQVVVLNSNQIFDRNGAPVPGRFRLTGVGNAVGAGFSYRLPRLATYVSAAVSIPIAWISGTSGSPPVHIALGGLADVYVQPLRLGWRRSHFDLVTGYAFYVPVGSITQDEGPTGVSRAQWTHEISFGGTVYFDHRGSWSLSALGAWDINGPKIGIDITRGETLQVQGGLAKTFAGIFSIGPVGYALYQVQNDRGAGVPPALIGARDRAFGLGGELDLTLEKGRSQLFFRYVHDVDVQTRPETQLFFVGVAIRAWKPSGAASLTQPTLPQFGM